MQWTFYSVTLTSLHCTLAVAQCIVIRPLCGWVCGWICYHDNSKLRASILTKLVVAISSWLNFGRPVPREGGLRRGENFWLHLTTSSAQCFRLLWALFSFVSSMLWSCWLGDRKGKCLKTNLTPAVHKGSLEICGGPGLTWSNFWKTNAKKTDFYLQQV